MNHKITPLGYLLVSTFLILLTYAAWIYSKSIDWNVLKKMESAPLSLPLITPVINTATISATPSLKK